MALFKSHVNPLSFRRVAILTNSSNKIYSNEDGVDGIYSQRNIRILLQKEGSTNIKKSIQFRDRNVHY